MNLAHFKQLLIQKLRNTDKIYSLFDTALTSLFRLGSSIVLAKVAGAEVFAQYVLITSGIVIVQSLAQNYFTTPIIHSAGLTKTQIAQLFCWSTNRLGKLQLLLTLIIAGILCCAYTVFNEKALEHISIFGGFTLGAVLLLSIQHIKAYRQTRFENRRMLFSNVCGISIHITIFAFGVITHADSPYPILQPLSLYGWGLLANYVTVYLISRPWILHRSSPIESAEPTLSPTKIMALRKDGFFMMLGSLTGIFSSRLQPFALVTFTSALAVAQFGAVMTIAGPIRMSSMFLQNVLRPRFALYHNQNNLAAFRKLKRTAIGFLSIAGIFGIFISIGIEKWLLEICFDLNESIPTGILPLAIAYTTFDSITSCQMLAMQVGIKNGVAITTRLRFISAIISVTLIIPLCFYGGAIGAILSLLAGEITYLILASKHTPKTC